MISSTSIIRSKISTIENGLRGFKCLVKNYLIVSPLLIVMEDPGWNLFGLLWKIKTCFSFFGYIVENALSHSIFS